MFHRVFGRAAASDGSRLVESWLGKDEKIINSFKVWRDEVVLTTDGIYSVNVKGFTGNKKRMNFTAKAMIVGVSFQNAYAWDRTVNVRVDIRGSLRPLSIRIRKADEATAKELVRTIKDLIKK